MTDYSQTRDASGVIASRFANMLRNLRDEQKEHRMSDYITLDTDELGIWLINETPEGPQQMGHISWKEITRGVQQALLQEKFLIALADIDQEEDPL